MRPDLERLCGLSRSAQGYRRELPFAPCKSMAIAVKVLTGDNELVSRKICAEVGIGIEQRAPGQPGGEDDRRGAGRQCRANRPCSPGCRRPTSSASSRRCKAKGHVVGFLGRRHQRRAGPACRRRRHFGRYGGRYRQGIRRRHSAGKELAGARGRRPGRAQGLRQHPQIYPHGGQFQLRQHVQRPGGEHLPAVLAHGPDPDSDEQSALRLLAGAHSDRRCRSGANRQAASLVDGANFPVHPVHRAVQLDLRLHDLFHDALRLRLLESGPCQACFKPAGSSSRC